MQKQLSRLVILLTMLSCASQASATDAGDIRPAKSTAASRHLSKATITTTIKAPASYVWDKLSDFPNYPMMFQRLQSVAVTKADGDLVYTESHIKPQMFVRNEIQHIVNDMSGKPNILSWRMLDGNFEQAGGKWQLKPIADGTCKAIYTIEYDPGPVIPTGLASFVLHFIQKDIVTSLKHYVESSFAYEQRLSYSAR